MNAYVSLRIVSFPNIDWAELDILTDSLLSLRKFHQLSQAPKTRR